MMSVLQQGEKFVSLAKLQEAVERYEITKFVQLYRRNTRTVEVYAKRVPGRNLIEKTNPSLKYAEIDLCCIHGGNQRKSRGTGQRPNQK